MSPLFSFFNNKVKSLRYCTVRSSKMNNNRQRRGISPVIATTIILAITIVLGLSLWSFANSGASVATSTYAERVTQFGRFTADTFTITTVDYNNPSANKVSFWIFNSGKTQTTIAGVTIICRPTPACTAPPSTPANLVQQSPADPSKPLSVNSKQLQKFTFDTTIESGKTYEITVVSDTGASALYVKGVG